MAIAPSVGDLGTLQNAVAVLGDGTALNVSSAGSIIFEVSGTYTGLVVNFEGSIDGGTTWWPVSVIKLSLAARTIAIITTAPETGLYRLEDAGGLTHVRARVSGTGTGALTVKARGGL